MRKYLPNNKRTRKAITRKETTLGIKCDHAITNKSISLILDVITEKDHNRFTLITLLEGYKWKPNHINNTLHNMKVEKYFSYGEEDEVIFSGNHHCVNGVWFVG